MRGRKCVLLCFALVSILLLSSCTGGPTKRSVEKTLIEAEEINANSDLGGLSYLEFTTHTGLTNDNPGGSYTDDGFVQAYYFKYPEGSTEKRRLTEVLIKGGDYNIFGIRVGDNAKNAEDILKQRGYKETKDMVYAKDGTERAYRKYDVIIRLSMDLESNTINEIYLITRR